MAKKEVEIPKVKEAQIPPEVEKGIIDLVVADIEKGGRILRAIINATRFPRY